MIGRASAAALYLLKQEFRSLADIRHPNLGSVMEERPHHLPPSNRRLLRLIAVAGDPIPQAILSSAAGSRLASTAWNEARVEALEG